MVVETLMLMKRALSQGKDWDAYVQYCSIPNDPEHLEEILYISNQLGAKERNIIKTYQAAESKYGNGRSTGEGS